MKSYFTVFCFLMLFVASTFTASYAQIPWEKDDNNPVMTGGASGAWNRLAAMPNVLYNSDSARYEMWYAGSPGSPLRPYRIGFATSPDGITWSKHPDPVLTPTAGTWDESTVEWPRVIKENGLYKMWYTGWSPTNEAGATGYATSPDGINWTKDTQNNPVMLSGTAAWEIGGRGYCTILPVPGGYKMWYTGANADWSEMNIGYATSPDGINWTKHPDPVLTIGIPGQWDNPSIISPNVVFLDSMYHMWYTGIQSSANVTRRIGWAKSVDGIQWTKNDDTTTTSVLYAASDPVLTPTPGQWDGSKVETGTVMLEGDSLRMWYSGWVSPAPPNQLSIGHATAPLNLNVPGDYASIQAAIDAAHDGNVVLVDEGTYYENINFKGKAITVASHFLVDKNTSHISKTIIDGSQPANPDSGSVVYFISGEDTTSVLMGFTITNGTGTKGQYTFQGSTYDFRGGGGIACWNSGGRIVRNRIINNTVTDDKEAVGGGFGAGDIGSNAYVILERNQIKNNTINGVDFAAGGGVSFICNGRLVDNTISYNSCTATEFEANGGGIKITAESVSQPHTVIIKGNHIIHNFAEGKLVSGHHSAKGGGIVNHYCKVIILNNEIRYNELRAIGSGEAYGAGINMNEANSGSLISCNLISDNTIAVNITSGGGGISLRWCDVSVPITNNVITGNSALNGGGIFLYNSHSEVINNTVVKNSGSSHGGGLYSTGSSPVVVNTILWANEATNGSQIYGSGDILYSDIQAGWSGEGNIDIDPQFVPDDSLYKLMDTGDTSICLNTGIASIEINNTMYYAPLTDFKGNPRPQPAGTPPDMGAWESDVVNALENIKGSKIPLTFTLQQNYPNPFNPVTTIDFSIPKAEFVSLKIYNLLGQQVLTLVSEKLRAGNYKYKWNASGFASGIYYYQLTAGGFQDFKKMILLR